ncbi:Translocation protein sec63 [Grifola frondosa]|uniref:Translocation protein sec63 n=1 Tax=Grifola frondosa TaxID=5627 RepID=A0A1C7LUX8_GRIFR|nr:Translocation protein sec63 [Grifola frondosa]
MANYNYDEAGNMAAYFLLTFLAIFLVPLSLSSVSLHTPPTLSGCQCEPCVLQRENIRKRERGSLLTPKLRRRTLILLVGWSLVAFLLYKIANTEIENKVYDPFEILGISSGTSIKEIKSHYKKLSRVYHPDKVKLAINQTMEAVEAKFVEITKAYKSFNGYCVPKWIVESGNNIWVLGAYGLIFGGALPALVGRWWFGNRQKTKDGVNALSAAAFFKGLTEESSMDEVVGSLGKTFEWEHPTKKSKEEHELVDLEKQIKEKLDLKWSELTKLAEALPGKHENRRRAFILLYAHLLRISLQSVSLREEQTDLLLQTPTLLNAMLNAYLAQALIPGQEQLKFAQLPGIVPDEAAVLAARDEAFKDVIESLEEKGDDRAQNVKKAVKRWGKAEIVDASFRLRLSPPSTHKPAEEGKEKRDVRADERDNEFLLAKKEAEDLPKGDLGNGYAHAPYWPANRKPSWWIVLADVKSNRIVVPPMKITDIPITDDYRSYKMQFQAPAGPGLFTWKIFIVSDTFVGEEASQDVMLKIDDASVLTNDDQGTEDDISDPEEDSLAGQMALMRGGSVKKRLDEESDEESSTDDDEDGKGDSGSSSDSD